MVHLTEPTPTPVPVVGVDGCRAGWLFAALMPQGSSVEMGIAPSIEALLERLPTTTQLAIDMPIGLPDSGPRTCDLEARSFLGHPRGTSIFPAPVRASLEATTFEEAQKLHREADAGRSLTLQTFHILAKIRELDASMRANTSLRGHCVETHPEVAFALASGAPLELPKRSAEGRETRKRVIDALFPGAVEHAQHQLRGAGRHAVDDVLDALIALWTAGRVARGEARRFPADLVERDGEGLAMVIHA